MMVGAVASDVQLQTVLATPLASLPFPARMETFFERRGLVTVADLVALSPTALLLEPNLGRKSIADSRALLRSRFQASWETLSENLPGRTSPVLPSSPRSPEEEWTSFRVTLPADALERAIATSELPARIQTFAARQRLRTIGELIAIPYNEIAEARGVGTGTLAAVVRTLQPLAILTPPPISVEPVVPVDPLPQGSHWRALLRDGFRDLAPRERFVLTQRCGLGGPAQTLAEVGECLGFSRERARQLESRGLGRVRALRWVAPARERLEHACTASLSVLRDWRPGDELFAIAEEDDEAFTFFVNEVLAGDVRLVRLDGIEILSRLTREDAERRIERARAAAVTLPYPMAEGGQIRALAAALSLTESDVVDLAPFLDEGWIVEDGRVTGFGTTKRSAVVAFVRAAGRPLRREEIDARFGRVKFPDELVLVDQALFALPEQVPDWQRWHERVPNLVASVIERNGPDRQWRTSELLPLLAEEAELPVWMNEWTLGSLLRDANAVRYLGRNVVALPDIGEDRLHIVKLVIALLEKAGAPMPEIELLEELDRSRGIGVNTWGMLRMRRPFVLFEDRRIGIAPRDLPASEDALQAFCEHVHRELDARQAGLSSKALRVLLAEHGAWDARVARTVLRHDGRFRCAPGGAVGLAEWESVRAPTQLEILEELMIEHDGVVPVETAIEMLPTSSGEPLTRGRIGLLANSIRARLVGGFIEWMPDAADQSFDDPTVKRVVASIPEKAAQQFCDYLLEEPRSVETMRAEVRDWADRLLREASVNANVEPQQVEHLRETSTRLVALCEQSEAANSHRLCSAAIAYLVAIQDAQPDLAVGGLDDDEIVLAAVETALAPPMAS